MIVLTKVCYGQQKYRNPNYNFEVREIQNALLYFH